MNRKITKAIREVDPECVITVEGIRRVSNLPDPADTVNDSFETILEKWGDPVRTEHFKKNLVVTAGIKLNTTEESRTE